jgi:hypothetical protein
VGHFPVDFLHFQSCHGLYFSLCAPHHRHLLAARFNEPKIRHARLYNQTLPRTNRPSPSRDLLIETFSHLPAKDGFPEYLIPSSGVNGMTWAPAGERVGLLCLNWLARTVSIFPPFHPPVNDEDITSRSDLYRMTCCRTGSLPIMWLFLRTPPMDGLR